MTATIGNPGSWSLGQIRAAWRYLTSVVLRLGGGDTADARALPAIRRIAVADVRIALRKGVEDFAACRTDVIFLCIFYPIMGVCLAWIAFERNFLPLIFPLISGFALIGPVAAVGLYEMSRRRELGMTPNWASAFSVLRAPSFGAILILGLMLLAIFVIWIFTANEIYALTLGPEPPLTMGGFARDVLTTEAGWAMIAIGFAVGFVFAAFVLAISVVSFPMLLDREVGLPVAVVTSLRVALRNPVPIGLWGLIVALGLALGTLPFFLGLIVIMPILGHATWHLYRRAVIDERPDR
ncbi:MAG TPA: DUF2189 domain-containing protein [Paracoccaceae bacterium]|nr:DUF2189 domain-containing protein [Paracoccaceae bacterium]